MYAFVDAVQSVCQDILFDTANSMAATLVAHILELFVYETLCSFASLSPKSFPFWCERARDACI